MAESERTVLVVDDDAHFRLFLRRMLEEAGYEVAASSSGQEALDRMAQSDIGVVVLDILMPGLDGFETLQRLREQSEVPVIMITGVASDTALRKSLLLGADDFMKKPFRSKELLARIEAKLRRKTR